jgi:hypothetical protein
MFVSCWSVKGGVGTTVVATSLALVLASRSPAGSVLVDLGGDVPAVLGIADGDGPGVSDWLAAGDSVPTDGWARLEIPTSAGVAVVPVGRGDLASTERAEVLAGILAADRRPVVVDCGLIATGTARDETAATVLASLATRSLLVTRACYLALRRAGASPLRPSDVVLVREAGRALGVSDVEAIVGADVVAEVPVDPSVARAVDAGLLGSGRLPRGLVRALRDAA